MIAKKKVLMKWHFVLSASSSQRMSHIFTFIMLHLKLYLELFQMSIYLKQKKKNNINLIGKVHHVDEGDKYLFKNSDVCSQSLWSFTYFEIEEIFGNSGFVLGRS
jgi:hypothetical protein